MNTIFSGSCACQRITYTTTSGSKKQEGSTICHCKTCQKLSGAPFQVYIGLESKSIIWLDITEHLRYEGLPLDSLGGLKLIRLTDIADRVCCATCGSWLAMRYKAQEDTTHITLGSIDIEAVSQSARSQLITKEEIYLDHKAEWLQQSAIQNRCAGMPTLS